MTDLKRGMENQEQLLLRISYELTLKEITTKLPWRELDVLACVSRGWRNAIRHRQVYEERVRSGLTETFIIAENTNRLVLHCFRDNSFLELPRCPGFPARPTLPEGRPWLNLRFKSIIIDGKIYILGHGFRGPAGIVYTLDVAGQRVWTQCASMQIPRQAFGCGSMDGKIYVFGGETETEGKYSCEVEVFDPKENRWSRMTPMLVRRRACNVVALGEELVVYSEQVVEKDGQKLVELLQIYHPLKDEWRSVPYPFQRYLPFGKNLFVVQGKLHSIDPLGIDIQDFEGNPCRELHSNSFAAIDTDVSLQVYPLSILVVDDKILATVHIVTNYSITGGSWGRVSLLRSRGFGTEKKEMAWREQRHLLSRECRRLMYAFQL